MSVLNKYKHWGFKILPLEDEYLDFVLSKDGTPSIPTGAYLTERCLSSFIDFGDKACHEDRGVHSYEEYQWENGINSAVTLDNIGFTGIDNGYIYYGGWDKITNKEFYDIFTTKEPIALANDKLLHLHQVSGNTCLYSYPMDYNEDGFYELKGGFFQGFYKLFGHDYQVLPQYIENGWNVEITLRPRDYTQEEYTLNQIYPENAGIFFYMGTRAENKFAQLYNCDLSSYKTRERNNKSGMTECDYFIEEEATKAKEINDKISDAKQYNKQRYSLLSIFFASDVYNYNPYWKCGCDGKKKKEDTSGESESNCNSYWNGEDGYYEPEISLSGDTITTDDGHPLNETGYYEIKTDNKFLLFDRTKYGFTTDTWKEGTQVVLTGLTGDIHHDNLFLLMDRTKSGYTTDTIDDYYSANKEEYNFLNSIMGNAFAMKINPDGSIGYKYIVKDCDNENGFSVLEESSYSGLVEEDKWYTIDIAFRIMNGVVDECGVPVIKRKMKIYVYVNGYLKFISKLLPEFDFRELNEIFEKQEGVPFNISVGGGTQGLCDSVFVDYNMAFEKILPIEQNFAGTFIGDIKSFRFYTCPLEYTEIKNNFLYDNTVLKKVFIKK